MNSEACQRREIASVCCGILFDEANDPPFPYHCPQAAGQFAVARHVAELGTYLAAHSKRFEAITIDDDYGLSSEEQLESRA